MTKGLITLFFVAIVGGTLWFLSQPTSFPESKDLPETFDLRHVNVIPGIREQSWGTCWAFATALSLETNLMQSGRWEKVEKGPAHLCPYYMDKYSGFTRKGDDEHVSDSWQSGQGSRYQGSNTDDPNTGLVVHLGGDYTTATAFLTNTRGLPQARLTPNIPRGSHHAFFGDLPTEGVLKNNNYTYFFPKKVIWYSLRGSEDQKRRWVKEAIINHGAVGSAQFFQDDALAYAEDGLPIFGVFDKEKKLDHAINLIGWDDNIEWDGHRGAWLAQDSDHRTPDDKPLGYFYVLYDDIYAAKDPWMGGVSFQDVDVTPFDKVYSHSLHGLRYSTSPKASIEKVANRFVAEVDHTMRGVGFYTLELNTGYKIHLKKELEGDPIATFSGRESFPGFHFLDITKESLKWVKGEPLFVELALDNKRFAYDASSTIEVLLKGEPLPEWGKPVQVNSYADKNESFYKTEKGEWMDFSSYVSPFNGQKDNEHAAKNPTANHAINLYVD